MTTPVASSSAAVLVSNWRLDDGNGTIVQNSVLPGFADGTLTSLPGYPAAIPVWKTFLYFDSAKGTTVTIPSNTSHIIEVQTLTVEAWIRSDGGATRGGFVLSKGGYIQYYGQYQFIVGAGQGDPAFNGISFAVNSGNGGGVGASATYDGSTLAKGRIWDDDWHHIAGTYDGQNVIVYVDGKNQGSTLYSAGINYSAGAAWPSQNFYIGGYSDGKASRGFQGYIFDVKVWDVALSSSEIYQHAQSKPGVG